MQTVFPNFKKYSPGFHKIVPFDAAKDHLMAMNFTESNVDLNDQLLNDHVALDAYINKRLKEQHARYAIGGYAELRSMYSRSELFGAAGIEEPRRLHLGLDIWGPVGTPIFAPLGGMVHSTAFNNNFGDYGATIILLHQLDGLPFYTLYGHLSLRDIESLSPGKYVSHGQVIAHFGPAEENGFWAPHLHFQIIGDLELKKGDYPGVCKWSEREKYLRNCPDPDLMLELNRFLPREGMHDSEAA